MEQEGYKINKTKKMYKDRQDLLKDKVLSEKGLAKINKHRKFNMDKYGEDVYKEYDETLERLKKENME